MQLKEATHLIEQIQTDLIVEYPFLSGWSVSFDRAVKRAGLCRLNEKHISVSKSHIENNPLEIVKDTILHEFAHAITYKLHGEVGHGEYWQQMARKIGATPKATSAYQLPVSPWMLVIYCRDTKSVKKLAPRYRKNKKIGDYFLRGQPHTKGKLGYICSNQLNSFEADNIQFEELVFVQ